jgi:hypothetical protein
MRACPEALSANRTKTVTRTVTRLVTFVVHRFARGSARSTVPYHDAMVDDLEQEYPWVANRDDRFTLALVLDVGEVLSRHGYPAPTGATLVDLTLGLYRALHSSQPYLPPPMAG